MSSSNTVQNIIHGFNTCNDFRTTVGQSSTHPVVRCEVLILHTYKKLTEHTANTALRELHICTRGKARHCYDCVENVGSNESRMRGKVRWWQLSNQLWAYIWSCDIARLNSRSNQDRIISLIIWIMSSNVLFMFYGRGLRTFHMRAWQLRPMYTCRERAHFRLCEIWSIETLHE